MPKRSKAKAHQKTKVNFYPYFDVRFLASRTIRELVKSIDFQQVCQAFNDWMAQYFYQEGIAIDGKSIMSQVTSSQDSQQNFGSTVAFWSKNASDSASFHKGK